MWMKSQQSCFAKSKLQTLSSLFQITPCQEHRKPPRPLPPPPRLRKRRRQKSNKNPNPEPRLIVLLDRHLRNLRKTGERERESYRRKHKNNNSRMACPLF